MFTDRLSRYRLTTLLVLAALVLFGLGAGHLATRALGAKLAPTYVPARTVFSDAGYRLQGDGLRYDASLPEGQSEYLNETDCVFSQVDRDLWKFAPAYPALYQCASPPARHFRRVLVPWSLAPGYGDTCSVPSLRGSGSLDICGNPNVVLGNMSTDAFTSDPNNKNRTPMRVYIQTGDGGIDFRLDYQHPLTITEDRNDPDTRTVSTPTTDDGAYATLWQYSPVPVSGGGKWWREVGTFSVPCRITVTKL